jgi:adenine-specific DNA-methyltransferase
MKDKYTGSLSLDWYNKQRTILLGDENNKRESDKKAPLVNWINKDDSLFYEIIDAEGRGLRPYWVDRNDIRVKEARPVLFKSAFNARKKSKPGTIDGMDMIYEIEEFKKDNHDIENFLIKGDNLLSLNYLKKYFEEKPEEERVKCIYIDPPYNTGAAFEHYDDNLEHSEWLTLMRDRLILLKDILSSKGVIFIQISDKQVGYLQVLMDEVFGRNNFINKITVRTKSPSGFQTVNLGVFETAEYILLYGKDKSQFEYFPQFTECEYDTNYNKIILNKDEKPSKWEICNLIDFVAKEKGFADSKLFKKEISKQEQDRILGEYAIKYSERVFRLTAISDSGAGKETIELKYKSKEVPDKILIQTREEYPDRYIVNGQEIAFYSKKIKEVNGKLIATVPLTNIWTDIAWEGISSEGAVEFPKSKKPERLIKRIIEMSTLPGDLVFDCFGGSGTTFAVAHKLNRRWIGVEIGKHSETLIIERLKSIIEGKDLSGITKDVNWNGGGSFKYYSLGQSIVNFSKDKSIDFNWKLDKNFIEESFLLSYDYELIKDFDLNEDKLFSDPAETPKIGIQKYGAKSRIAIITLCPPDSDNIMLKYDELHKMYKKVMDKYNPEYINIFTNKGIEIAFETKPEKLEVIKVPSAIYSDND